MVVWYVSSDQAQALNFWILFIALMNDYKPSDINYLLRKFKNKTYHHIITIITIQRWKNQWITLSHMKIPWIYFKFNKLWKIIITIMDEW